MHTSVSIITPAQDVSLMTLYEAKVALSPATLAGTTASDEMIEMLIEWASSEIAAYCNRTFAQETLVETFFELGSNRLPLSHYPVKQINSVTENGTVLTADDYDLDAQTGILTKDTEWSLPTVVDYRGGYDLPFESPLALRQAALLMTREAYYAAARGDATIRMVSHKETRVIYFDPNAKLGAAGGTSVGSPTRRAVNDLLDHFRRFYV